MDIKKLISLLLFGALFHTVQAHEPVEGLIKVSSKEAVIFTTRVISKNDEIKIQYPDKNGNAKCCSAAKLIQNTPIETDEFVSDELHDKDVNAYRISTTAMNVFKHPFVGMAIIGQHLDAQQEGINIRLSDGQKKSFMYTCLSADGVHLIRKIGGQMLGHLYMALGYDVVPTCKNKHDRGQF